MTDARLRIEVIRIDPDGENQETIWIGQVVMRSIEEAKRRGRQIYRDLRRKSPARDLDSILAEHGWR